MVLPGLLYTSYILYNDTIYPFILLVSGIKCNVILIELDFLCLNQNYPGKETKY